MLGANVCSVPFVENVFCLARLVPFGTAVWRNQSAVIRYQTMGVWAHTKNSVTTFFEEDPQAVITPP